MDVIKEVAQFFLLSLSFGTFLFSFITPSKLTGAGFIRLIATIGLATVVVSGTIIATSGQMSTNLMASYIANIILIIAFYKFHKDERSTAMTIMYSLIVLSYVSIFYFYANGNIAHFSYMLLGGLFVGIVNYPMTLGHYYLVVPRLSEWPLLKAMKIFWFVIAVKLVVSIWGYVQAESFFNEGSRLGAGYMFNWILLSMRVLWGYVALGVLSVFAYKLCKMRSIQSATGVFYVMVFFVFVGEIISGYLFYNYGLYL